ncbi:MAG: UTP--glucose-1-phosphate uridylyltransferase [Polyangiales bacterium]
MTGTVEVPLPGDITALPAMGTDARRELETAGLESMRRGEVGVVARGRYGNALWRRGQGARASPSTGTPSSNSRCAMWHVAGRAGATVPVYLMTSFATDERIREEAARLSSAATPIDCFAQFVSMRVTPNGELHRDVTGAASLYAPGHGDLPFALRRSHVLSRFRAAGGKYLSSCRTLINLAATLDPAVIGAHGARRRDHRRVVQKEAGDAGGAPHASTVCSRSSRASFSARLRCGNDLRLQHEHAFVFTAADIDRDFELSWSGS